MSFVNYWLWFGSWFWSWLQENHL